MKDFFGVLRADLLRGFGFKLLRSILSPRLVSLRRRPNPVDVNGRTREPAQKSYSKR